MKTLMTLIFAYISVALTVFSYAAADTVGDLIRGLKDPSPDARVKAIQDLCAG